jgi:hypothetical protein
MGGRIEMAINAKQEGTRMDRTYYEAHANEDIDRQSNHGAAESDERRTGQDRRQGADRRKQERRKSEQARARLTPQEIAALLNGSR